jgi:hypothetical protein
MEKDNQMRMGKGKEFLYLFSSVLLVISAAAPSFSETRVVPVANISVLGGQYFLKGQNTSFGGNVDLFYTPVINFSPEKAFLPMFSLTYRGTKDVQELVGGGTLTQEYMDIGPLTLKYILKTSETFKVKVKAGYKIEYLKETKDEQWQKGLFDYNKALGGMEIEKTYPDTEWNMRIGVDAYSMKYPNYASLISNQNYQAGIDTTTYKELSNNAGTNVLDNNTNEVFVEFSHAFSDTLTGKALYDIALKNFGDQKIVNKDGTFATDLRNDTVHFLTFGITGRTERTIISLTDSVQLNASNQNSYDASLTQFIPNFYNFFQNGITPSLTFNLGETEPYSTISLYWDVALRQYSDRFVQAADGTYNTSEKINQVTSTQGLVLSLPLSGISKGLSFRVSGNYRSASSNMKYEKFYLYNYSVTTYFTGITWEM